MPQTFGPNGTASAKPLRFPLTNGCLLDGLADDPAVASRSIRRAPLDEHRMRTKWPTMFNPSTDVGDDQARRYHRGGDSGTFRQAAPAVEGGRGLRPALVI
jgi:hypothetical protein